MVDPLNSYVPNPTIYENTGRETRGYDVFSRLLKDRIVFLGTEINDDVAPKGTVIRQDPLKGRVVAGGTVITLTIKQGAATRDVKVTLRDQI